MYRGLLELSAARFGEKFLLLAMVITAGDRSVESIGEPRYGDGAAEDWAVEAVVLKAPGRPDAAL